MAMMKKMTTTSVGCETLAKLLPTRLDLGSR